MTLARTSSQIGPSGSGPAPRPGTPKVSDPHRQEPESVCVGRRKAGSGSGVAGWRRASAFTCLCISTTLLSRSRTMIPEARAILTRFLEKQVWAVPHLLVEKGCARRGVRVFASGRGADGVGDLPHPCQPKIDSMRPSHPPWRCDRWRTRLRLRAAARPQAVARGARLGCGDSHH